MPDSIDPSEISEELYRDTKSLRSSTTSKRLRRLRVFERTYYKKTCEMKKTGHNLDDAHHLNDGGLRYSTSNLTYSLNKKKRWLLPDILQKRICEYDPSSKSSDLKNDTETSTIDERLKIVMYENENIRHAANCIRYANSQAKPQILYKNGQRFNSATLTKWINFETRERWHSHHRNVNNGQINQPNFGIERRPGFFPSEVTYEFLYPKRIPSNQSHKKGKTTLSYSDDLDAYACIERTSRVTNKNRRKILRYECMTDGFDDYECILEKDLEDNESNEFIITASSFMDENEKWLTVFEESDDQSHPSVDIPVEYFIPITSKNSKSTLVATEKPSDPIHDRKAKKYFEVSPKSDKKVEKPATINEDLLCSISYENESDFLSAMQQSALKISQANLSPPIFVQQTISSSFSVIYSFLRKSLTVDVMLKFIDLPPNIVFDKKETTLDQLVQLISKKLDEYQIEKQKSSTTAKLPDVDALRGSLPLPLEITKTMILVRPKSTDKLTALKDENLIDNEHKQSQDIWYNTITDSSKTFECSICCDTLTSNETCQILPCHHTLCHACLTSYIRTSVSSATYSSTSVSPIPCFEQNCSTELNSSLLQAFLSYEIYRTYNQSLIDRRLYSVGKYRKCPSHVCSNLLIVDDKTNPSLMCTCGQRVCSECLEEYHFPATCQQLKIYQARLRESGDDLLSSSKIGDNSSCYIAEGKNCPNCGEFVEKNGGCPHMTCKCGNEYCWMCLKRWATHNYAFCQNIPESTHELRSSTRNRLHNKAVNHRRERNEYSFNLLLLSSRDLKKPAIEYNAIYSTYIDLNTLAEFVYVLLQRRRTDINIRAVLARTAKRLESDAFKIKLQVQDRQINMDHIERIRLRLSRTVLNLLHMKENKVLP